MKRQPLPADAAQHHAPTPTTKPLASVSHRDAADLSPAASCNANATTAAQLALPRTDPRHHQQQAQSLHQPTVPAGFPPLLFQNHFQPHAPATIDLHHFHAFLQFQQQQQYQAYCHQQYVAFLQFQQAAEQTRAAASAAAWMSGQGGADAHNAMSIAPSHAGDGDGQSLAARDQTRGSAMSSDQGKTPITSKNQGQSPVLSVSTRGSGSGDGSSGLAPGIKLPITSKIKSATDQGKMPITRYKNQGQSPVQGVSTRGSGSGDGSSGLAPGIKLPITSKIKSATDQGKMPAITRYKNQGKMPVQEMSFCPVCPSVSACPSFSVSGLLSDQGNMPITKLKNATDQGNMPIMSKNQGKTPVQSVSTRGSGSSDGSSGLAPGFKLPITSKIKNATDQGNMPITSKNQGETPVQKNKEKRGYMTSDPVPFMPVAKKPKVAEPLAAAVALAARSPSNDAEARKDQEKKMSKVAEPLAARGSLSAKSPPSDADARKEMEKEIQKVAEPLAAMGALAAKSPSSDAETKSPAIPLPNLDAEPTTRQSALVELVLRLERDGLISPSTAKAMCDNEKDHKTLLALLREWNESETQGKRPAGAERHAVLQPDSSTYPNAKPTSFKLHNLAIMLHEQLPEMWSYLSDGFENGFSTGVNPHAVFDLQKRARTPKQTAAEEVAFATSVDKDFALGYLYKATRREKNLILSAAFCVPKRQFGSETGKFRNVLSPRQANDNTSREDAAITYTSVIEAARAAVKLRDETGQPVRFAKFDCKHAFHLLPMRPSEMPLVAFESRGEAYMFGRITFGLRCGSRIFSAVAQTANWLLRHVFLCPMILTYCDDFLLVSSSAEESEEQSQILELVFALLGIPIQEDKSEVAKNEVVFLGTLMCSNAETLDLPLERKKKLVVLLESWATRDQVTIAELRSLTGTLNYVTRTCPSGKLFLRRLYGALSHYDRNEFPDRAKHAISAEMRKDLDWWMKIAPLLEPLSMRTINQTFTTIVFTDASDWGGAGYTAQGPTTLNQYYQTKWEGQYEFMRKDSASINVRELFAIVQTAMTFGHCWKNQHVQFNADNMASVLAVIAGSSKNKLMMHYLRVLALLAALGQWTYRIQWIAGITNIIADAASRKDQEKIAAQFPQLVRSDSLWVPRPDEANWEQSAIRQWSEQLQARNAQQ